MGIKSRLDFIIMRCRIKNLTNNKKAKVQLGKSFRLEKNSNLIPYPGTKIVVGDNVYLRSNPYGYHTGMPFPTTVIADKQGASITIGNNCRLNGVYVHAQSAISIGDNCVIAAGVNIIDSNGHQVVSSNRTVGRDIPKPVFIGNNVWIGINAIVLKGTTIGDNCIVSAGSVVVGGDYPKNSLLRGNPAQVVGTLSID
jgi:acetyltransferase-like isoleucine patch superfamily enzyme